MGRHTAVDDGIHIRPDGFCRAMEVLGSSPMSSLSCTIEELKQVVQDNDKQRFDLQEVEGELMVRAANGHSMKEVDDESLFKKKLSAGDPDLPEVCVHGTY